MIEITKNKNPYEYDEFYIKTDEGEFKISYLPNLDLYWTYIHRGNILTIPESHEFTITKENYFFYELLETLYENIKNSNLLGKILDSGSNETYKQLDRYTPNRPFEDGMICWHSDESSYESASILQIKKEDEIFKIIFTKSKKQYDIGTSITFSVRINNNGTRYTHYNVPFMKMYLKLKEYDPNYHQIHIEEYLSKKKKLVYKQQTIK